MQIKNVTFCVLAFVAIPCNLTNAGFPAAEPSPLQQSLEFKGINSGRNMRQSTTDPIGFDSGLWRAEYLTQQTDENSDENSDEDEDKDPKSSVEATTGGEISASTSSIPASRGSDNTMNSRIYSDKLALMPIEIPIIAERSEYQPVREHYAESAVPTMSDWEYAAVTATKSTTIGFTTSGPSATSAIVGFVGIMIVIGAYVSSSERKS